MFKVDKGLAPIFMNDIFPKNDNAGTENISSNTRSNTKFYNRSNPKTVNYGLETLRYLGPRIWQLVPMELREIQSLNLFTKKIKKWSPNNCPCRLCKLSVPELVSYKAWLSKNFTFMFYFLFFAFIKYIYVYIYKF